MLRRALAHFEQPVAAEPAPGSPAAAAGLPSLPARIGSTLAYGLLVAAYWTAAARAVALCNPLAAMRSGTVAALVFDIGQLPHTLVLLLSLDHWAWHALNALAVAKKGMLGLSAFAGRGVRLPELHYTPWLSTALCGLLSLPAVMASHGLQGARVQSFSCSPSFCTTESPPQPAPLLPHLSCSSPAERCPRYEPPQPPCARGCHSSDSGPRPSFRPRPGCMPALPACRTRQKAMF